MSYGRHSLRLHCAVSPNLDRNRGNAEIAIVRRRRRDDAGGGHTPPRGRELPAVDAGPDDRRPIVRKLAGHRREIADVPIDHAKQPE